MVNQEVSERERPQSKFMATTSERSRSLHNFSLPSLKWGNQRLLRCMKLNSDGSPDRRNSGSELQSEGLMSLKDYDSEGKRRSSSPNTGSATSGRKLPSPTNNGVAGGKKSRVPRDGDDEEVDEIRAKLMVHLRTAAHKMNFDIPEEREGEESLAVADAAADSAKPWNLRKRRAACYAPSENEKGGASSRNEEQPKQQQQQQQNSVPVPVRVNENHHQTTKSLRLRGFGADQNREKERPKLSIPLSRDEIEEDFMAMLGTKPSRRPKKRSKNTQKQLDACFPGLWLPERVTVDDYRVSNVIESGKR